MNTVLEAARTATDNAVKNIMRSATGKTGVDKSSN